MAQQYPGKAGPVERAIQIVLGITALAFAGLYSMVSVEVSLPDTAERAAIMLEAVQVGGIAFALAVAATFVRKWVTEPPLVFIWGMLLITALVAWGVACLTLLSSM